MPNRPDKPVIVLGAGGHATVLIDCLQRLGAIILGLTDIQKVKGECVLGVEVLGNDGEIASYNPEDIYLVNGIGMNENLSPRRELALRMRQTGYTFGTIVDPTAMVLSEVELGEGVQVMAGVVIQSRTSVGQDTIINTSAMVDHDCVIEEDCHVCPGVILSGGVTVGGKTMIGAGSTVVPGKSVGKNSIIAAASVVHSDVPDNVRLIQRRNESTGKRR